jgi:hypothetical protein
MSVELRLPMIDITKYLVYVQCELYEYAASYYGKVIKQIYHNVLTSYEQQLKPADLRSRRLALQQLFEFEFLLDMFKAGLEQPQLDIAARCKDTLWKALSPSSPPAGSPTRQVIAKGRTTARPPPSKAASASIAKPTEETALTEEERELKKKQLKIVKYKAELFLLSFPQ